MLNRYTTPTTPNSLASTPKLPSELLLRYAAETNRQNELAQADSDSMANMLSSLEAKLSSADAAKFQEEFKPYADLISQVNETGDYRAMTSQLRRSARDLVAKASDPSGFYSRAANWNATVREMASELEKDRDKLYPSVYNVNRRRLMEASNKGYTGTGGVAPQLLQNVQGKDFDFLATARQIRPTKQTKVSDPVWDENLGKMRVRFYDEEFIDYQKAYDLVTSQAAQDPEYIKNVQGRAVADYYELASTNPEALAVENPTAASGFAVKTLEDFVKEYVEAEIDSKGKTAAQFVAMKEQTFKDTFFDDDRRGGGGPRGGNAADISGSLSATLLSPVGKNYDSVEDFVREVSTSEKQTMQAIDRQLASFQQQLNSLIDAPGLTQSERSMRARAVQEDMQSLYAQKIQEQARFDSFRNNAEKLFSEYGLSFETAARVLANEQFIPEGTAFMASPLAGGVAAAANGLFSKRIALSSTSRSNLTSRINEMYGRVLYETELIPFSTDKEITAASNLIAGIGGGTNKSAGFVGSAWLTGENAGEELKSGDLTAIKSTKPIGLAPDFGTGDYRVVVQTFDENDQPLGIIVAKSARISRQTALQNNLVSPEHDFARSLVHSVMNEGSVRRNYDNYQIQIERGARGTNGIQVRVLDPKGEPVLIDGLQRDFGNSSMLLNSLAGLPQAIEKHKAENK